MIANYTQSMAKLFTFMVLVTTSVSLIFYLAGALAALWLRAKGRLEGSAGFMLDRARQPSLIVSGPFTAPG